MHTSEKGVNATLLGVNNDLPWCQEDVPTIRLTEAQPVSCDLGRRP